MLPFEIPTTFLAFASRGSHFAHWLEGLPALVRGVVKDWDLTYDGPPLHGYGALVVPVRTAGGRSAMLKLNLPHDEAQHEHLALEAWRGNGTVRLLGADPHRWALLLERLHSNEDLTKMSDVAACEVVAGFYERLHVLALPQLRTLSSYLERWTDDLVRLPRDAPVPRRLVERAISLGRELVSQPSTNGTMVHGDLHYFNVLAADREPWLVIDPKPMSGNPHYEVAPMLWNRWEEAVGSGNVRDAVRRRFHTLIEIARLDEDLARDWVIVREVHNALWTIQDAARAGVSLTREDKDWITVSITIAKAVTD